jgi:hypothetical protein
MSVNEQSRMAGMFRSFIREILIHLHMHVPAKITEIDYDKGFIKAKPLIKMMINESKIVEEEEIFDVPITTMSFDNNNVSMTFPLKVGDKVFVIMSDRDTANLINSDAKTVVDPLLRDPFGVYPIGCLPFHTFTKSVPIDKENIIIKNNNSKITVGQDDVDVNGAKITPDGDVVSAEGVSLTNHTHNGGPVPDKPGV